MVTFMRWFTPIIVALATLTGALATNPPPPGQTKMVKVRVPARIGYTGDTNLVKYARRSRLSDTHNQKLSDSGPRRLSPSDPEEFLVTRGRHRKNEKHGKDRKHRKHGQHGKHSQHGKHREKGKHRHTPHSKGGRAAVKSAIGTTVTIQASGQQARGINAPARNSIPIMARRTNHSVKEKSTHERSAFNSVPEGEGLSTRKLDDLD